MKNAIKLLAALIFISIAGHAQVDTTKRLTPLQGAGFQYKNVMVDSSLRMPSDTFKLKANQPGYFAIKNGQPYLWYNSRWASVSKRINDSTLVLSGDTVRVKGGGGGSAVDTLPLHNQIIAKYEGISAPNDSTIRLTKNGVVTNITLRGAPFVLNLSPAQSDTTGGILHFGSYPTVAAMLASNMVFVDSTIRNTNGFYAPGDGGGARYRWAAGSAIAADNVTIFAPTNGGSAGRWFLIPNSDNSVSLSQFGIFPTGSDISPALQIVFNYINGKKINLLINKAGNYVINTTITISNAKDFNINGLGAGSKFYSSVIKTLFYFQDSFNNLNFKNFALESRVANTAEDTQGLMYFYSGGPIDTSTNVNFENIYGKVPFAKINMLKFVIQGTNGWFYNSNFKLIADSIGRFAFEIQNHNTSPDIARYNNIRVNDGTYTNIGTVRTGVVNSAISFSGRSTYGEICRNHFTDIWEGPGWAYNAAIENAGSYGMKIDNNQANTKSYGFQFLIMTDSTHKTDYTSITNNTVNVRSFVDSNSARGFNIHFLHHGIIANNNITSGSYALQLVNSSDNRVTGNTFHTTYDPVVVHLQDSSSRNIFLANTFTDSGTNALAANGVIRALGGGVNSNRWGGNNFYSGDGSLTGVGYQASGAYDNDASFDIQGAKIGIYAGNPNGVIASKKGGLIINSLDGSVLTKQSEAGADGGTAGWAAISGGTSGTAGGSAGQFQYNTGTGFGGAAGLTRQTDGSILVNPAGVGQQLLIRNPTLTRKTLEINGSDIDAHDSTGARTNVNFYPVFYAASGFYSGGDTRLDFLPTGDSSMTPILANGTGHLYKVPWSYLPHGTAGGTGSTGTVTSVALSVPTGFSTTGSPVTSSGTLGITTAMNGPVRGNGTGFYVGPANLASALDVTGNLPVTNLGSGTGANATTFWRGDGVWAVPPVGTSGTSGLTNLNSLTASTQAFAVGTAGTDFGIVSSGSTHTFNIPNSSGSARGLLLPSDWSAFNAKQAPISLTTTGSTGPATFSSNVLNIPNYSAAGYITDPTTTTGDIIYRSAGGLTRLPIGGAGQTLHVTSGVPVWRDTLAANTAVVISGTFTPSATTAYQVIISTINQSYYTRIGNVVTVAGTMDITPSFVGATCRINLTIPVATTGQVSNTGAGTFASTANFGRIQLSNSTAGSANTAYLELVAADANLQTISYHYTYYLNAL